jgi:hypothetical protein
LSANSKKEIYFDYTNITLTNGLAIEDSRIGLKESELKVILLFFSLDKTDFKELNAGNRFNINKIAIKLNSIESEYKELFEYDMNTKRQIKLKRILDTYKNIYLKLNTVLPNYF